MIYLDANIIIYSTLNTQTLGEKARAILESIQRGEERAVTSALTFEELFWEVKRHDLKLAFEACEALLNFPNLEIIAADRGLVAAALQMIKDYHLAPRDAFHAASAIAEKVDFIISTDKHFDKVKELKRKDL